MACYQDRCRWRLPGVPGEAKYKLCLLALQENATDSLDSNKRRGACAAGHPVSGAACHSTRLATP